MSTENSSEVLQSSRLPGCLLPRDNKNVRQLLNKGLASWLRERKGVRGGQKADSGGGGGDGEVAPFLERRSLRQKNSKGIPQTHND